jgi:hypothetical protein
MNQTIIDSLCEVCQVFFGAIPGTCVITPNGFYYNMVFPGGITEDDILEISSLVASDIGDVYFIITHLLRINNTVRIHVNTRKPLNIQLLILSTCFAAFILANQIYGYNRA